MKAILACAAGCAVWSCGSSSLESLMPLCHEQYLVFLTRLQAALDVSKKTIITVFLVLAATPWIMWKIERVGDPLCPGNFGPLEKEVGGCTQSRNSRKAQQRWRGSVCLLITSAKDSSRDQGNIRIWKLFPEESQPKDFYTSKLPLLGKFPLGLHNVLISCPHASSLCWWGVTAMKE